MRLRERSCVFARLHVYVCIYVRACARGACVPEREGDGEKAMRCPDCFNPTGNAAVSRVTAERACVRASARVCVGVQIRSRLWEAVFCVRINTFVRML